MGAYKNAILADGPVGFWVLGDTSGTNAPDLSGNGFNGTYTGGFTLNQSPLLASETDGSTLFNGSSGYVAIPSGLSTAGYTALTVVAWLQWATAVSGDARVVDNSHTDADHNGFELVLNTSAKTGSWVLGDGTNTDFLGANSLSIAPNTPIMYAGKLGSGHYSIWLNGVRVALGTSTLTLNNGAFPVNLGRGSYNNDYYSGMLGFVAIFNKEISDARLYQYYSLGKAFGLLSGTAQGNAAASGSLFIPTRPGSVAIGDAALSVVSLTDSQVA